MKTKTTRAAAAPPKAVLPTGSPDQIVKGALKLSQQEGRVGVKASTVTENTAARGTGYDRDARALMWALVLDLDREDPELAQAAGKLAKVLGVDPQQVRDALQRQELAWDSFRDVWAIRGGVRTGRRVVDGTRLLARGMVEADVEKYKATLPPEGQRQIDGDLKDYEDAGVKDQAGKQATRKLTKDILGAGQQQIGDFRDRRQLVDTLDRLAAKEDLPWDVLVKAGDTLDKLMGQQEAPAEVQ